MNDRWSMEAGTSDSVGGRARAAAKGELGVVQSFVEMPELRRIMRCLAAIEVLRLIIETDAVLDG